MAATHGDPRQHMLRLQMPPGEIAPPLFSPALPSAFHHHQFRQHSIAAGMPGFPPQLQQQPFFPQPPPHMPHRGSIVGFPPGPIPIPAIPMGPPPGPMTPVGGSQPLGMGPPHHLGMGHNARQGSISLPFTRNRRQPSISTGGPPKATLGGPQNKHIAPSITNPATASAALQAKLKGKKLIVNLPREKETVGADGENFVPLWTRNPIPLEEVEVFPPAGSPEMTTAELWPEPLPKGSIPPSIEVFLPGKGAWEYIRIALIEEKLEKLGVEPALPRGPLQLGIHGRAASISSPADPQLLLFKLNKLQQQGTSPTSGLSVSPQPPALSPSPGLGPRFPGLGQQMRHGHSLSLSNPPASFVLPLYNPTGAFNPFGPAATLGSDSITRRSSVSDTSGPTETEVLHQPRGIVPNRPGAMLTRPDFIRGFGLDIAEETEEEMEEEEREVTDAASAPEVEPDREQIDQGANSEPDDRTASGLGSRKHSRHTSRVSIALSLRSLGRGGRSESGIVEEEVKAIPENSVRPWGSEGGDLPNVRLEEGDMAAEWTGSESVQDQVHEGDDEESITSEYSNPSDEERARQARQARLERRRQKLNNLHDTEGVPRRLPNFPRPPESIQRIKPRASEESMISNPSEEERLLALRMQQRLNLSNPGSTPRSGTSPFGHAARPLPPIPSHSRTASGQHTQLSPHHVPLPHSRQQSGHIHSLSGSGGPTPTSTRRESLNPNAKPFVFSKQRAPNTSSPPIASAPVPALAAISVKLNAAAPEFKPSLNPSAAEFKPGGTLTVAAQEFKPSAFIFRPPQGAPHVTFPEPMPFVAMHYSTQAPAESPSALDDPPINAYGRAYQGREKRARRGSEASVDLPPIVDAPITHEKSADEDPHAAAGSPPVGADGETWNNLAAFKFPPSHKDQDSASESNEPQRESLPPPPRPVPNSMLNATAKPFVFPSVRSQSTSSPTLPSKTEVTSAITTTTVIVEEPGEEGKAVVRTEETEAENNGARPLPIPPSPAPRKPAPLNELPLRKATDGGETSSHARPLPHRSATTLPDFRPHPISTNTVPAGLFKKLASGDVPTVRSRLGSREVFEHNHRPSLDDIHMPAIARKGTLGEDKENRWEGGLGDDLFAGIEARGLSSALLKFRKLPGSATHSATNSTSSFSSELKKQSQLEHMEQRVDELLEEKMDALRRDLREVVEEQRAGISSAFNRSTAQTLALIRNMRNVGEENRAESMGEVDFELIRNIVEDGNKEVQASVQRDLAKISSQLLQGTRDEMLRTVEEQASRMINALHGATMNMCARIDAVDHLVREPDTGNVEDILRDFMLDLEPHLANIRTPQLDVDAITARLSEAVRPSLAQLIDFASDKKETATLIVEQLAPHLASLKKTGPVSQLDTQAIASQLAADVSRLVPPVDSHALTEQVADLVVERLNARLENRDKMLRPDVLAGHVVAEINPMLPSLGPVHEALGRITTEQSKAASAQQLDGVLSGQRALSKAIEQLPELIRNMQSRLGAPQSKESSQVDSDALNVVLAEIQKLTTAHGELNSQNVNLAGAQQLLIPELQNFPDVFSTKADALKASQDNLAEIVQQTQNIVDNSFNDLFHAQNGLETQVHVLLGHHDDIVKQIKSLPEALAPSTKAFEAQQADFLNRIRSLPELIELQHARSDLQQQLLKARHNHGQIRSEKDHLQDKLTIVEVDRERLRTEVQLLKSAAGERETEQAASAARISALESNLQDALTRVNTAEGVNQALRQQITGLESNQRELQKIGNERSAKINSLELQLQFAKRDVESSKEAQVRLEKERDAALDQQQQGGADIQLMSEKLEALMGLMTNRDNDELRTLRRERDRAIALEHETTAAKRRITELESKVNTFERAEATSRKSLEYSQQQAQEAEETARRLADDLARLDETDKARDAELVQLRAKVDSYSAAEHDLTLRNESLEEELASLQAELKDQATARWQRDTAKAPSHTQATPRMRPAALTNGKHDTTEDPSRASTPSHGGVWDSMHAPKVGRPTGLPSAPSSTCRTRYSTKPRTNHVGYHRPPSPAQSVVSQAPTLREDGWWDL